MPYLWENPVESDPFTDSPTLQRFKKLPPASKDWVLAVVTQAVEKFTEKAIAQAEGSE
jgi:hypothetical protein